MPRQLPAMAFGAGAILHAVFWLVVINFDSTPLDMQCGEISCWTLFFADLPFSIFYISGSATFVTAMSFIVGSIWWGAIASLAGAIAARVGRWRWRTS